MSEFYLKVGFNFLMNMGFTILFAVVVIKVISFITKKYLGR